MNYLVIGAGKSGVAAANFLAEKGHRVSLSDSRAEADMALPYELDQRVVRMFGTQDPAILGAIDAVVLSPGVPRTIPIIAEAYARRIAVIGEIELAYRQLRGRVVAITGSNGKSTTTALIGEILREAGRQPIVAGNIGEPLIHAIDREHDRTYVLELSSFQLETVDTFHADVALLLNITPDHMDRYESFDEYAAAKYRIFRNQGASDTAIVNVTETRDALGELRSRLHRFSGNGRPKGPGAWLDGTDLVLDVDGTRRAIARSSLRLAGAANVENALAAWLAVNALGVEDAAVERAFRSFAGLPHRMVLVRELDGVKFVNDSKGTNVDATLKSLEGEEDGRVVLILGGKDKAGEFERMRELVAKKARAILTIGSAASKIEEALAGTTEIIPSRDMAGAIRWARQNAKSGDTVLLSPACASFDQYRNFEHRGEHFEELVRQL